VLDPRRLANSPEKSPYSSYAVWSLVVMEIFLEKVRLDYILPLYTLFWIMAYSDISKAVKTEQV
jgi:hypothetical protein